MTESNLKRRLGYSYYEDMEDGRTIESVDYEALIALLEEMQRDIATLKRAGRVANEPLQKGGRLLEGGMM